MKRFFPDSTRSGYISKKPSTKSFRILPVKAPRTRISPIIRRMNRLLMQWSASHKISRVIHVCDSEEGLVFKCQRKVSSSYAALSSAPLVMHPLCKQCFPDGVEG